MESALSRGSVISIANGVQGESNYFYEKQSKLDNNMYAYIYIYIYIYILTGSVMPPALLT